MKLLTKAIENKLRKNAKEQDGSKSFKPVLKVFNPYGGQTWLFSELDDSNILFGLADLGFGSPELGYVSLDELAAIRVKPFNRPLERDMHFSANKLIGEYADEARKEGRIIA